MLHESDHYCPECDEGIDLPQPRRKCATHSAQSRRDFLAAVGTGTAALVLGKDALHAADAPAKKREPKPAEGLIRELYESLSAEQKKQLVLPWDYKSNPRRGPARLGTYNSALLGKRMDAHLRKPQQELVQRTVQSILSNHEAWERITRYGKWDGSGSFERCGCVIFGEPSDDKKFSWVFSGHHLTLRCDGNSEPNAAFGGPIYYGHSIGGYHGRNVYHYQTQQVQSVFDALDGKQREKAIAARNPGDRERGIQFPEPGTPQPGIGYGELAADQQKLVANVMRTLLEPFRKEDGDEVMQIIKANGGLEKIHLAFYKDRRSTDDEVLWNYWRLEGPGFIWNYRVLPHVHCYVNIVKTTS